MKEKFKTKNVHSNDSSIKPSPSNHENFKLGQGYGSSEPESESQEHLTNRQYGDNPIPKSGGGYGKAGHVQPKEDAQVLKENRGD